MMKPPAIDPGSRIQSAQRNRPASRPGGSGFSAHLQTESTADPAPVADTPELIGLDALLALQEVSADPVGERRQALQRHGEAILDQLDRLRTDLLVGGVSQSQLVALTQRLRARPPSTGDERLDAVLGEIELRAEVEMAKLQRRHDSIPGNGSEPRD